MDAHQSVVSAAHAAKSSDETPKRAWGSARSEAMGRENSGPAIAPPPRRGRSALGVFVMAAPPDVGLVASPGGTVEPLVHAPETVQPARKGGIGMVDDAVLERE